MKHRMLDAHFDVLFPRHDHHPSDVPHHKCPDVVPVDMTNVAEYVFGKDGSRKSHIYLENLPNIACPWPVAWFECKYPGTKDQRWGVKVIRQEIPEEWRDRAYEEDVATLPLRHLENLPENKMQYEIGHTMHEMFKRNAEKKRKTLLDPFINLPRPRWFTILSSFMTGGNSPLMFGGVWVDYLDEHGSIIHDITRWYDHLDRHAGMKIAEGGILIYPSADRSSYTDTQAYMEAGYIPMPEQKKHAKKYGSESVRFHKLHIDSLKMILRKESENVDHQIAYHLPLHIQRGHFKDFRQSDKGLFGRHKGIYWWEQHTRGSKSEGEVKKEYVIDE
jgi:hypothetical protein